ncbi:hypothetical protein DFH09DRAFT_1506528 [Mycena vulgaris]|nr:hypothetical protein DFH09DRAFT_1506528 [Mycena vulgaris]
MSRLAQKPLLALSQVCARWHHIVMGTPALWATIQLADVLWCTPTSTNTAMRLLRAALERGGKSLVSVTVTALDMEPHGPALELLAAHSERWQVVEIISRPPGLGGYLASAKGRLPRLETLKLWGIPPSPDIFSDTPRLTKLDCMLSPAALLALRVLPLHQLREFSCAELVGVAERMGLAEVSPVLSLMPRLARGARLDMLLRLVDGDAPFSEATVVPPVTSAISVLSIAVEDGFSPSNIGHTMSTILGSLTLPVLDTLVLISYEYPHLVLPWPHTQFLALGRRSSFHTHLQSLELSHADIDEAQLLECLSTLPCLECLGISDHQVIGALGADQLLITDSLLEGLTPEPDAPSDHVSWAHISFYCNPSVS